MSDMQTLARFTESPFSLWRASRSRSRLPQLQNETLRFQTVGSISEVSSLVGARGLPERHSLPRLVSEGGKMERRAEAKGSHAVTVKDDEMMDSKLIELAVFPGYDPDCPTPLPHGLDTLEQMKRVTRAQMILSIKRDTFRECWKKLFYSKSSQSILLDTFWWYFLHRYQENKPIQDKLFTRIATNYVALLCEAGDNAWGNAFFKVYPNAIAQCVYTSFIHAFPASWSSFDESFKAELCRINSLWQNGSKPIPNVWQKWNLDILEPNNLLKHIGKEDPSPVSHKRGFDLDALISETDSASHHRSHATSLPPLADTSGSKRHGSSDLQGPSSSSAVSQSGVSESRASFGGVSQEERPSSKIFSFVDVEQALFEYEEEESRRGEEAMTAQLDARTQGEATPTMGDTATRRTKIEVAKEQLSALRKLQLKRKPKQQQQQAGSSLKKEAAKTQGKVLEKPPMKSLEKPPMKGLEKTPQKSDSVPPKAKSSSTVKPRSPVTVAPLPAKQVSHATPRKAPPAPRPHSVAKSDLEDKTPVAGSLDPDRGQCSKTKVDSSSMVTNKDRTAAAHGKGVSSNVLTSHRSSPVAAGSWREKALAMRSSEDPVPTVGPQFEHGVFDIHGHSPLVKHYLQRKNLSYDEGFAQLTRRTEIGELPPTDALSYKEVLREAVERDRKTHAQFQRHYVKQKQLMSQSKKQQKKESAKHEQDVKKILSNKKEVRQVSTELTSHILGKKKGPVDKKAVSSTIEQSLDRVSNS